MVSICIPCYNNAVEVERLLNSIVEQSYKDYEVNISDDSTNDETEKMMDKFRNQIEKLNYRHNEKPFGHIFNWNEAIKMATGEYIKIMFSDDWFTNQTSLASYVKLLDENPKAMLAFSGSRQVMLDYEHSDSLVHLEDENRKQSYDRCADDEFIHSLRDDYRYLYLGNQIGAPSAVIYRRGEEVTLFDEKSNWASDMYLYFDLLMKSREFAYTKAPLVSIGVHEHQYTEMFAERDMRVYQDYRYLYTKYELEQSKECQIYFLKEYLIKYKAGVKEARALSISTGDYMRSLLKEWSATICCFIRNRLGK